MTAEEKAAARTIITDLCGQLERIAAACAESGQPQPLLDVLDAVERLSVTFDPDMIAPLRAVAEAQRPVLERLGARQPIRAHGLDLGGGRKVSITFTASERPSRVRSYPVGLVGEQLFQATIRDCAVGEAVSIVHERGNPHDEQALVALAASGARIGYVSRDNWLRDAVFERGHGTAASIKSITPGDDGILQLVLDVTPNDAGTSSIDYEAR